jgi:hypothetical protein
VISLDQARSSFPLDLSVRKPSGLQFFEAQETFQMRASLFSLELNSGMSTFSKRGILAASSMLNKASDITNEIFMSRDSLERTSKDKLK